MFVIELGDESSRLELKFSLCSVDDEALDCGGGDCVEEVSLCKCVRGVPTPILISASTLSRLCELCLEEE